MIVTLEIGNRWRAGARPAIRCSGFSLIELLVVMTIMVILTSLFPLALEHMVPARKLAATSQELISTLQDLQSIALATGSEASLVAAGNRYSTRDGRGAEKTFELPTDMTVRLLDDVSGRVLTDLTFFPDGSSSGGRFEVQYSDKRRSIVVTRLMGRVRDEG